MAESTALSKSGEIAIVRANQVKATKENERKITALQKIHADEAARQKADLERAVADKERINTENKFLKRDLTEEEEKIKSLRRSLKNADVNARKENLNTSDANASPLATPKKGKQLAYRDGFDDDEIFLSPSKVALTRATGGTPKAGAKRKRRAIEDSPAPILELSPPKKDQTTNGNLDQQSGPAGTEALLHSVGRDDGRFEASRTNTQRLSEYDADQT